MTYDSQQYGNQCGVAAINNANDCANNKRINGGQRDIMTNDRRVYYWQWRNTSQANINQWLLIMRIILVMWRYDNGNSQWPPVWRTLCQTIYY